MGKSNITKEHHHFSWENKTYRVHHLVMSAGPRRHVPRAQVIGEETIVEAGASRRCADADADEGTVAGEVPSGWGMGT